MSRGGSCCVTLQMADGVNTATVLQCGEDIRGESKMPVGIASRLSVILQKRGDSEWGHSLLRLNRCSKISDGQEAIPTIGLPGSLVFYKVSELFAASINSAAFLKNASHSASPAKARRGMMCAAFTPTKIKMCFGVSATLWMVVQS